MMERFERERTWAEPILDRYIRLGTPEVRMAWGTLRHALDKLKQEVRADVEAERERTRTALSDARAKLIAQLGESAAEDVLATLDEAFYNWQ